MLVSAADEEGARTVEFKEAYWRRVRKVANGRPATFVRKVVMSAVRGRERQAEGQRWILTVPTALASLGTRLAEAGGYESVSDLVIAILEAALADMGIAEPEPVPEGGPKAAVEGGE